MWAVSSFPKGIVAAAQRRAEERRAAKEETAEYDAELPEAPALDGYEVEERT